MTDEGTQDLSQATPKMTLTTSELEEKLHEIVAKIQKASQVGDFARIGVGFAELTALIDKQVIEARIDEVQRHLLTAGLNMEATEKLENRLATLKDKGGEL